MPINRRILKRFSSANLKHFIHVTFFILWLVFFQVLCGVIAMPKLKINTDYSSFFYFIDIFHSSRNFEPFERYGTIPTLLLYFARLAALLSLPQQLFNAFGLICFNGFKNKVRPRTLPMHMSDICFRVVTRGDYPKLVKENVDQNIETCFEAGLENFVFEVVTDKPINLESRGKLIREIVVPLSYKPRSGAKFKARALQYCLEDQVNLLRDNDWIVHLDEETLLSMNSVYGIFNFCEDGKHHLGQGLILYANGQIVNWITTLSDSLRVSDDLGKLRFQLKILHRAYLNWKGSFVVAKAGVEKRISFDHGLEGSIAEDCFFAMVAIREGYSFDFIEGEMFEKSTFSMWDYIRQRQRWFQGISYVVHSKVIPISSKFLLTVLFYAWATMPFAFLQIFLAIIFPLPKFLPMDIPSAFLGAMFPYLYIFGVVRSFGHKCKCPLRMLLYTVSAALVAPITLLLENIAVLMGIFSPKKYEFYIVDKDLTGHQLANSYGSTEGKII